MRRILKARGWGVLRKEGNAISLVGASGGRVLLCTSAVSHPCDTGSVAQSNPCFWRPPTVWQSWLVFPYKHFRTGPVLHSKQPRQVISTSHTFKPGIVRRCWVKEQVSEPRNV